MRLRCTGGPADVRLAVYTDYEYREQDGRRYGQRAFVVFLEALAPHVERLVLVGRLDPRPGRSHYALAEDTELVGLPHYESLLSPLSVARSLLVSLVRLLAAAGRGGRRLGARPLPALGGARAGHDRCAGAG